MIDVVCSFCQKLYDGDKLFDNVNKYRNKFYLTCVGDHLRLWENHSYKACYDINYCPVCGRNITNANSETKGQVRCENCKFSRPIDRTKSPEKYFRDDCVVCECEDVVGDKPMVYPNSHYCGFGSNK